MNRKNLIDGLPNSYDTNYIIKTNKVCELCKIKLTEFDIENNLLLCSDDFDFFHKDCLQDNNIKYEHQNQFDQSTPVTIIKP